MSPVCMFVWVFTFNIEGVCNDVADARKRWISFMLPHWKHIVHLNLNACFQSQNHWYAKMMEGLTDLHLHIHPFVQWCNQQNPPCGWNATYIGRSQLNRAKRTHSIQPTASLFGDFPCVSQFLFKFNRFRVVSRGEIHHTKVLPTKRTVDDS